MDWQRCNKDDCGVLLYEKGYLAQPIPKRVYNINLLD
jgi:hypothetical protein